MFFVGQVTYIGNACTQGSVSTGSCVRKEGDIPIGPPSISLPIVVRRCDRGEGEEVMSEMKAPGLRSQCWKNSGTSSLSAVVQVQPVGGRMVCAVAVDGQHT